MRNGIKSGKFSFYCNEGVSVIKNDSSGMSAVKNFAGAQDGADMEKYLPVSASYDIKDDKIIFFKSVSGEILPYFCDDGRIR